MSQGGSAGAQRARSTFTASVGHALRGLREAARHRNMRIQLVAGMLATGLAAVAPLARAERALLLLCTFAVLAAEAANTALEAAVDLHGGARSDGARLAKDAAAGAVLALSIGTVTVLAAVLEGRAAELWAARGALALPLAAVAGVAAAGALLLGPAGRHGALRLLLTVLGAGSWVLLALLAASLPCALVPGLLLALGVASGQPPSSR